MAASQRLTTASAIALALSAVCALFSIAIAQIFLGAAIFASGAAFLFARQRGKLPAWWIPLLLYMLWTMLSAALSPPVARHLSQIAKFWLFSILPVGYFVLHDERIKLWTVRGLAAVGAMSSVAGIVQFIRAYFHWQSLNKDFYANYQLDRITGFKHHWMTFSGQLMLILMLVAAWIVARKGNRWEKIAAFLCATVMAAGLLLSFTRGAWIGSAAGIVYLLWLSKPKWIFALPVLALLGYLIAPGSIQQRVRSIVSNQDDHSAAARRLMYRAGWSMIKAHPLIGIGPEGVQYEFDQWRPDTYKPIAWYGHLHSDYLQTAASRGLPALAFLLAFFFLILRDLHRLGQNDWLARGAAAATIAFYIEGFVEYNFGGSEVLMMWMFVIVLAFRQWPTTESSA